VTSSGFFHFSNPNVFEVARNEKRPGVKRRGLFI